MIAGTINTLKIVSKSFFISRSLNRLSIPVAFRYDDKIFLNLCKINFQNICRIEAVRIKC